VYVFYKINGWRENYVAGSVFYSALVLARCLWICKTENLSYSRKILNGTPALFRTNLICVGNYRNLEASITKP
jgi:hypothetical protein